MIRSSQTISEAKVALPRIVRMSTGGPVVAPARTLRPVRFAFPDLWPATPLAAERGWWGHDFPSQSRLQLPCSERMRERMRGWAQPRCPLTNVPMQRIMTHMNNTGVSIQSERLLRIWGYES